MTTLHKTKLTTSLKVNCAVNSLACQDKFGAVAKITTKFGISKPTFYELRKTTEKVLTNFFEEPKNPTIEVSKNLIKRTVVALHAMAPNSYRAIEDLLPIIYPGTKLSFGSIWNICHEAEITAALKNKMDDLGNIKNIALDELFSQNQPVLGNVDLDSGYIVDLKLASSRSQENWDNSLKDAKRKGLEPDIVVSDAGQGISSGVSEVFPNAEKREDVFHVLHTLNKEKIILERIAYGHINTEANLEYKLKKTKSYYPGTIKSIKAKLRSVKLKVALSIKRFDFFDSAVRRVALALDYMTPGDLQLRTPEESKNLIEEAALLIEHVNNYKSKKIAKYLRNRIPGLLLSIESLYSNILELQKEYDEQSVLMACAFFSFRNLIIINREPHNNRDNSIYMSAAYLELKNNIGKDKALEIIKSLEELLLKRYRASSPIEGINAALRPYLYCRKNVSQNFLELYRFYQNRKTKRWGRHKGISSYEKITGLPAKDWLNELGLSIH